MMITIDPPLDFQFFNATELVCYLKVDERKIDITCTESVAAPLRTHCLWAVSYDHEGNEIRRLPIPVHSNNVWTAQTPSVPSLEIVENNQCRSDPGPKTS